MNTKNKFITNKKFKLYVLTLLFVVSSIFLIIDSAVAFTPGPDIEGTLENGDFVYKEFSLTNNTLANREKNDKGKIVNLQDRRDLLSIFTNNSQISVYLLNRTSMGKVLSYGNLNLTGFELTTNHTHKIAMGGETFYEEELSYDKLLTMGFEYTLVDEAKIVYFTILAVNEVDGTIKVEIDFPVNDDFNTFWSQFWEMLIWVIFVILGVKLISDSRKIKEENPMVSNSYLLYGISLLSGAVVTGSWAIYHWYNDLKRNVWVNPMIIEDFPAEQLNISDNYLTFVTFTAAAFSMLFMNLFVERQIQQRKKPYFTYALMLMQALIFVGMFAPAILVLVFWVWAAVVVVVVLNIFIEYLKLVIKSTGILRKKSLLILLGIALTYISVLMREFMRPDYIGNLLSGIFVCILYYGIKLDTLQ